MEEVFAFPSGDILGIIVLIFLICMMYSSDSIKEQKMKLYMVTVCMTLAITILEVISILLDWYPSKDTRGLALVVNSLLFAILFLTPVTFGLMYNEKLKKKKWLILAPAIAGDIMVISSIWNGLMFYVDSSGVYHRGKFFFLIALICFWGMGVILFTHIDVSKEYDKSEKIYLWLLFALLFFTSIIQVIDIRFETMWGGIAVTEVLYYVFLRETGLKYDTVTGTRNRNSFERQLESIQPDESLFLLEFDVNNLKKINDTYGHAAGDNLIRDAAMMISEAYRDCGLVYRIGGDEFAVIAPLCSYVKVEKARKILLNFIKEYREVYSDDFYIANAYCRFDRMKHKDIHECLCEADRKMYEDKLNSKR